MALARAEVSWESAGRLRAAPPRLDPESIAGPAGRFEALFNRRRAIGGLLAASVVAGVATVAVEKAAAVDRYSTGVGIRRVVQLADGSRINLNTATVIEVALKRHRRTVHLLKGEALFDVAHDASRPFLVMAGPTTLRVLGTAFNVRLRQELVELTVTRGMVGVSDDGLGMQRVPAGNSAAIRDGVMAVTALDPAVLQQRTLWQDGVIELDGDTLAQAVDEFNRYRVHPMVIGDPSLASIRMGGRFATRDSRQFVEALEQSFAIRALPGPDHSILLVKAS